MKPYTIRGTRVCGNKYILNQTSHANGSDFLLKFPTTTAPQQSIIVVEFPIIYRMHRLTLGTCEIILV